MAMTGITVPDEVIAEFSEFKLKRTAYKYITYKIEGSSVVAAERIEKTVAFEDFLGTLSEDECRFIVMDHEYKTNDGRDADKVVFISWVPDTCKVRDKMKYSGTKEALKSAFVGISVNINATDFSECSEEEVNAACTKV